MQAHSHVRRHHTQENAIMIICMLYLYANASILWMNYDYLFKFGTFLLHDIFGVCMENARKNRVNPKLGKRTNNNNNNTNNKRETVHN